MYSIRGEALTAAHTYSANMWGFPEVGRLPLFKYRRGTVYFNSRTDYLNHLNTVPPILRTALYVSAVALLVYHWRVLWPRMWKFRQEYINHADEPDVANPALDRVRQYVDEVRAELDEGLAKQVDGVRPEGDFSPALLLNVAVEHRLMHAETLSYMLHRLPYDQKIAPLPVSRLRRRDSRRG